MEWEILGIILVGLYAFVGYIFHFPPQLPYSISSSVRDDRMDQMRGLAMIGIVCIHIHSYFEFFHPNDPHVTFWTLLISNLSRFSVPVFIFGSSLYLKKKPGYWQNKVKSLILPYSLASLLGYIIKYNNLSVGDFLIKFLTGQTFAPYYFVPLLCQFYLLYFILPDSFKQGKRLYILFISSIILNLLSNLNYFNNLLPSWYEPISIFNFIFFFFLGLLIKELPSTNNPSFATSTLIFLLICAIGLLIPVSYEKINIKNHHIIYPLLTILVINQILPIDSNRFYSKFLKFIGKNSLYIFLIHPFVIHQMHAIDPFWFINPFIGYLVTLILNVGIPSLIAYSITSRLDILLSR